MDGAAGKPSNQIIRGGAGLGEKREKKTRRNADPKRSGAEGRGDRRKIKTL